MTNTQGAIPPVSMAEFSDAVEDSPTSPAPTTTWKSSPVPIQTGTSSSQAGTRKDHGRTRASTSATSFAVLPFGSTADQ